LNITLLCTPRSAGNFYTGVLAKKYNIPDLGEYLHGLEIDEYLPLVHNMPAGVHKISPKSIDQTSLNFILANSDKNYFLIRQDKEAQLRSFFCARYRSRDFADGDDTGGIIDITVSSADADIYRERFLLADELIRSYAERYAGKIKYTEDIVKDNYEPYTQKYNFTII
jgi:hypothetical protein